MKGDECFFLCRERGKYLSTIGYSKKKKKKSLCIEFCRSYIIALKLSYRNMFDR